MAGSIIIPNGAVLPAGMPDGDDDSWKELMQRASRMGGPLFWFEMGAKIEVKGRPQRVQANILQRRIFTYFRHCYVADKPCRGIGLKPRRRGFSTALTACHYWYMRRHGVPVALLGHQDNASTEALWGMLQGFHRNDLTDWGNSFVGSKSNLEFSNGSKVLRLTDQNPGKIRGSAMVLGHSTETAFYDNADETLLAAKNTLDQAGGFTSFWQESTPFGSSGAFFENFMASRWPEPDECPDGDEYWRQWETILPNSTPPKGLDAARMGVRIFAAWFEFDLTEGDKLSPLQKRDIQQTLDAEEWYHGERDLIERYGEQGPTGDRLGREVTGWDVWEQLAWRRNKIWDECKRDRFKFQQEYPADPVECFLSSGQPYFDRESLNAYGRAVQETPRLPAHGVIEIPDDRAARPVWRGVALPEDAIFQVWEPPQKGCHYLVAVDPAKGQDAVAGKDPDCHSVLVLRRGYATADGRIVPPAMVARIRPPCRVPLYVLAEWIDQLSAYFGRAVVVVENNIGQGIVEAMRPYGTPLWRQRVEQDPRTGRRRTDEDGMIGWNTNAATKPIILDNLHQWLREEIIDLWCPHLISELRTFSRNLKKGTVEAQEGSHDDDVMALAIGVYLLDGATLYQESARKRSFEAPGRRPPTRAAAEAW